MIRSTFYLSFYILLLVSIVGCSDGVIEEAPALDTTENTPTQNQTSTASNEQAVIVTAEAPPLFKSKVSDDISNTCVSCHAEGKIASKTNLVFYTDNKRAFSEELIAKNYVVLYNYAQNNAQTLLDKVLNVTPHVGGNIYLSEKGSRFQNLKELVEIMLTTELVGTTVSISTQSSSSIKSEKETLSDTQTVIITNSSSTTDNTNTQNNSSADNATLSDEIPALFTNSVYPKISSTCLNCHTPTNIAAGSGLVFNQDTTQERANYNVLKNYVQNSSQRLLDKVLNKESHVGGNIYISEKNPNYINLKALVAIMVPVNSSSSSSEESADNLPALFRESVYPDLQANYCFACHSKGAIAGQTSLIFEKGDNKIQENYAVLNEYAQTLSSLLLEKVIAKGGHKGGNLYVSEDSLQYKNLKKMLEILAPNAQSSSSSESSSSENNASQSSMSSSSQVSVDEIPAVFTQSVYPNISTNCMLCHASGLIAGSTNLVFIKGADKEKQNYAILKFYISNSATTLLKKVLAIDGHGGGNQYGDTNSVEYTNLKSLIDIINKQSGSSSSVSVIDNTPKNTPYFSKISYMNNEEVLRKASIILVGRIPTQAEITAVKNGNDATLKTTLRTMMNEENFAKFVYETADTHFLMSKKLSASSTYEEDYFPDLAVAKEQFKDQRSALYISVRNETLELVKYIVLNDRSYQEILTADYTMVNPYLNVAFKTGKTFKDNTDLYEWQPAKIQSNEHMASYPHAGVLTMASWLKRFPTTDTNRNRHRAKMFFKQFLGVDIESLAQREVHSDGDYFNPVMQNPHCVVCHETMDPVAGAFQNWGISNRYRRNVTYSTALPYSYLSSKYPKNEADERYYQKGDTWFRDVFAPGFNGEAMEGGYKGKTNSLQWLASRAVNDERFALGAVKFWYEGLFGIKPLASPFDETDVNYEDALAGFKAQDDTFKEIATRFRSDLGNGAYNVKDLLIDLVMSNYFRAKSIDAYLEPSDVKYSDIGMSRLLTPEQLQRKLFSITNKEWNEFRYFDRGYALNYGGFDTGGLIDRNTKLTMLMGLIVERMSFELSCSIVADDFKKEPNQRILFPNIDIAETEASNEVAVRKTLVYLHKRFLGEDESIYSREINASYQLFVDVRANKDVKDSGVDSVCDNTVKQDTNYSGQAWSAIIQYLLTDPSFIYE